jgi:hypothetical protein
MSDTESSRPDGELARLIDVLARQVEASRRTADLIESRALPLLERIALALERSPSPSARPTLADGRARAIEEVRRAINDRRWEQAEAIVRDLGREHPDDSEVAAVSEDLERTRRFAVDDLRDRIEAARGANDPDGVMGLRDELARILHGEPFKELDRGLVKWLMSLIQRRLRTGTVRPDVAELAARVADRFGGTTEGASLRAALPTLRRSAGLCPKCGEPYAGLGDACPKCLALAAAASASKPHPPDDPSIPEDVAEAEIVGEPVDLNNERFWEAP